MYPEADFRTPLRAPFRSTFSMEPVVVLLLVVGGGDGGAPLVLEVLLLVVVAVRCRKLISTLSGLFGGGWLPLGALLARPLERWPNCYFELKCCK